MEILMLDAGYDSMSDYFRTERNKVKNCHSCCLYKKTRNRGIITKFIQFVGIYLFSPILFLIYGDWKYKINSYDVFIVTSRRSAKYALKLIKKKTKNKKRIIIWYWNIVTKEELDPILYKKKGYEVWTFDSNDAEKYGMQYNNTYYFDNFDLKNQDLYDIMYVGVEKKGRIDIINNVKKICDKYNLKYNFNIVRNPNYKSSYNIEYSDNLDYFEILKLVGKSKAILDLNNSNQVGLTLRPLEALFFQKKLITNNKNIINYDFYSSDNIFILDVDSISDLPEFLNKKYKKIEKKIIEKYVFSNWLKRLISIRGDKR